MNLTKHISVSIQRSLQDVYDFASDPLNLPQWASGLSGRIELVNEEWVAISPMGTVRIRFAPKNEFGVLDHEVTLESGEVFYNPMRVFPNGDGSEVVFTLFKTSGVSDEKFEEDAAWILKDLNKLKEILEK